MPNNSSLMGLCKVLLQELCLWLQVPETYIPGTPMVDRRMSIGERVNVMMGGMQNDVMLGGGI